MQPMYRPRKGEPLGWQEDASGIEPKVARLRGRRLTHYTTRHPSTTENGVHRKRVKPPNYENMPFENMSSRPWCDGEVQRLTWFRSTTSSRQHGGSHRLVDIGLFFFPEARIQRSVFNSVSAWIRNCFRDTNRLIRTTIQFSSYCVISLWNREKK